jgi:hypothetical protein
MQENPAGQRVFGKLNEVGGQVVEESGDLPENLGILFSIQNDLQRICQHGLELDLVTPDSVRAKLAAVPLAGRVLVPLIDALDGIELEVHLGQPTPPKAE